MHRPIHHLSTTEMVFLIVFKLFVVGSVTCFLTALHRIAHALALSARMTVLHKLEPEFAPEERDVLVHKIKSASLRCL